MGVRGKEERGGQREEIRKEGGGDGNKGREDERND